MELFLFRHSEYERLYNCSRINIDDIPIDKRRQPIGSIIVIVLSAVYYLLYFLCFPSIFRQMRTKPCYQILFFIAILDLSVLWIIGFLHGWLGLQGAVYCSHPTLIYLAGNFAVFFWMIQSCADILLALNRCCELISPNLSELLFSSVRIWLWLFATSLFGVYRFIFVKPILFSSIYFQWYFNPFQGYISSENNHDQYHSLMAEIYNGVVAVILPLLYTIFAVVMIYKSRSAQTTGVTNIQLSRTEKLISLQIFLISMLNTTNCTLFVIMQDADINLWWMDYLTHLSWIHIHGFPPVIYLTLNKTIRNETKQMLANWANWFLKNRQNKVQALVKVQVLFMAGRRQPNSDNVDNNAVGPSTTENQERVRNMVLASRTRRDSSSYRP